jgi:hypothetical protein
MTVRINKQKINLREKLAGVEGKVNFDEVVRGLGEYTGNIGIGTTNPSKTLYVDGSIRSTSSINYEDKEILSPGFSGAVWELFVVEPDSHYMVTVARGDTPSQVTVCIVTTRTSINGEAADVNIHEITNSGHYSIIYETSNNSIRWKNDTASNPPKINASVLKLK